MPRPQRETVLRLAVVGLAYAATLAGGLAIRSTYPADVSPLVWPAMGVALAGMLLVPRRERRFVLAIVFVVALAAFLLPGFSLLVAGIYAVMEVISLAVSAWVIRAVCGDRVDFGRPRDAFALIGMGAVVSLVTGIPFAVTASTQIGVQPAPAYGAWVVSVAIGLVGVTPAIVTTFRPVPGFWRQPRRDLIEVVAFTLVGIVATVFIFGPPSVQVGVVARPYMYFPLVIWAALRFGPTGTSLATVGALALALALTLAGETALPLGGDTPRLQVAYVEAFFCVAMATGLILAASVAAHRAAETAARASDARYRAVADHATDWITWTSAGLAWHYVSPECERITGYTAAEFLADPSLTWKIAHPDDRAPVRAHFEPSPAEDAPPAALTYRIVRRDGAVRWVDHACRPVRDADGSLIGRRTTNRDVTDEKRLADALRASEALLRLVYDAVPANIAYFDTDLRYRITNRAYAEFIGRDPTELVGMTAQEALGPRAWARVEPNLRRGLAGESFADEFPFPVGDGDVRWVRATYTPDMRDGTVAGLVVMVIDLTDRRRLEADLAERERRYRLLTETMRDVVWAMDAGTFRFTYVSPSVERLRGFTPEEVMAEPAGAALAPEYAVAIDASNRSRAADFRAGNVGEDTFFVDEVPQLRKDGSLVWTEDVTNFHADPATGQVFVHGLSRDITERRRAQEALIRASRMEAVGQLAGGVAHDFNNLLTAIRGFADFLRADLPPDDPHVEDVDEIIRAADRAAELTRSLLAYSRRQILLPQLVRPADLIDDLEPMLRRLVGERIALDARDISEGVVVSADPSQLDQVVVNLVVNARHAMPEGGEISVVTRRARVDGADDSLPPEATPGEYAVIEVRDSGVGMDAATRERIFEPFFSTREPGQGSGLGLATVDGIVRQSGGFITVDSAPGHGAAFRIHLPAVAASDDAVRSLGASVGPSEMPGGSETVLVVEDDRAVRAFAVRTLADAGYAILEAGSGEEAIAMSARHETVHLLLTDLRMPGIQGRDLADRLASDRPEMRILLMTGFDDAAAAGDDAVIGGRRLIHKPFGAEALATAVRDALDAPA